MDVGTLKRAARWLAVSTVGATLVVAGIAMLFVPGPGLLVIAAGLAVLSIEFLWARRLREETLSRIRDAREARQRRASDGATSERETDAA